MLALPATRGQSSGRSSAGGYAEAKFRLLRRRWRRRVLPRLAIGLVPITFTALALSVFGTGVWAWLGAVWFGAAVGFCFYAVDAVPRHIENWGIGADGERRTEKALRPLLRTGWVFLHDLERPGGGNIDHVAIGPGGVFVMDTKVWSGVVTVDDVGATISPRDDPSASWHASGQQRTLPGVAAAVGRALASATERSLPGPTAIVVLWSPFPQRVAASGKVTYVSGEHLADWLIGQPRQLHPQHLAALAASCSSDKRLLLQPFLMGSGLGPSGSSDEGR